MPTPQSILPFDRWSFIVLLFTLAMLSAFVAIDAISSLSVLVLYLIPVCVMAWLVRGYWWLVMAMLCAVGYVLAQRFTPDNPLFTMGVIVWNGGIRFLVLAAFGWLVHRLKTLSRNPGSLMSAHDTTGMLTMLGLDETLRRADVIERFRGKPVALMLIDAERKVSAFQGHGTEHSALVAAILSKAIIKRARPDDLCVRLSPNHYLLVMPGIDRAEAFSHAASLADEFTTIRRTLDDSFVATSLVCWSSVPVPEMSVFRRHTENRLTQLKILSPGKHHEESFDEAAGAWERNPLKA